MKIFKFVRCTSLLLFSFILFYSSQSSAQCIYPGCIQVTAPRLVDNTAQNQGIVSQSQQPPNTGSYYSGISGDAYKQKQAAEEEGAKKGKCYEKKANVPIDQETCRASVNTLITNWSVANCQDTGGTFDPTFNFNGASYSFAAAYPSVKYSSGAQCQTLTTAAINQFQSDCKTKGDTVEKDACTAAGVQ